MKIKTVFILVAISLTGFTQDTSGFDLDKWRILLKDTVVDVDRNVYHTQQFDTQIWMVENLAVTKFNDGTQIPRLKSPFSWKNAESSAITDLTISSKKINRTISPIYYNGYVVESEKNVCPVGWHIPSNEDWEILLVYLDTINEYWILQSGASAIYSSRDTSNTPHAFTEVDNHSFLLDSNTNKVVYNNWDFHFFTKTLDGMVLEDGTLSDFNSWGNWWTNSRFYVSSWYGVLDRHFTLEHIYLEDKIHINRGLTIRCIKDQYGNKTQ